MNRRIITGFLLLTVFTGFIAASGTTESPDGEPITLRMATAFTLSTHQEVGARMFLEKVEQQLADEVVIEYIGGPEAISPFELFDALRSGSVDIAGLPGSYFQATVPETATMYLSELSPSEERENGAFQLFQEYIADRGDAFYLGRYNTSYEFNFYTATPIRSMDDFQDVTFRISPVYRAFLSQLGGAPITMAHSEVYTGLERGMIEGIGATNFGVLERGWQSHIGYIVDPSFYGSDQVFVVNLSTWNTLPDEVQNGLMDIVMQVESESGIELQKIIDQERNDLIEEGIEIINIQDGEAYRQLAYDSAWNAILETIPESGEILYDSLAR